MSGTDFDPEAVIDAMSGMLGLEVTAQARPSVRLHLEVTARMAQMVLDFPLDEDAEPAPVFTA